MADQRIGFSKSGRARYISHLDLMRTFQRAFLRADLHVKHTEGFNPHAYVSIPLPLSVGFSSECEMLEFGLPPESNYDEIPSRLTAVLPEGIEVHSCYDVERPVKQLAYVNYIVTLEYDAGAPVGGENAIRALLSQESWVISKKSKKAKSGFVQLDLIPLIHKASFEGRRDAIVMDLVLQAQNPGLNPSILVAAIEECHPELKPDYVCYHRKDVLDAELKSFH